MARTVTEPLWEGARLSAQVALALAEDHDDKSRTRRLLERLRTSARPPEVAIPDPEQAADDVASAIEQMRVRSPHNRRGELLTLIAIEHVARSAAADRLHMSERQFYRLRGEAVEELAEELTSLWRAAPAPREQRAAPPARAPITAGERLPTPRKLVGRTVELERAAQELRSHGVLLLGGPPGVGKTALATQIATMESSRYTTLWHRFRVGLSDTPEAVLLTLSVGLAAEGDDRLQQLLARTATRPLWVPGAVQLARQCIGSDPWLLCFDDTDVIVDNAPVCSLLQLLFEDCPAVRMLLIGRSQLWQMPDLHRLVLGGLERDAALELLGDLAVEGLTDQQVSDLLELTGGSPQLIRLAANVLAREARPGDVIAALQDEPDVHSFLLVNVFERLREEERTILGGASLLRSGVTAAFLARAFKDVSETVPDALARLARQFLLANTEQGLRLHATLRQFCAHQLTDEQARDLHRMLARAYAADGNTVEAGHHGLEAGDLQEVTQLLAACTWQELPADRRLALVAIADRLIDASAGADDAVLRLRTDLLRSVGRGGLALEHLQVHGESMRLPELLLSLTELEREAGHIDAARSGLRRIVSSRVRGAFQWQVWAETARVEQAGEDADAAVRAARHALSLAGESVLHRAQAQLAGTTLLPTESRLAPGAGVVEQPLTPLVEKLDPVADGWLIARLALGAVSREHPDAAQLLQRLRLATRANDALEADLWFAEAVDGAATGDYRNAADAAWRAAERAAAQGRAISASLAGAHTALYRAMADEADALDDCLGWARAQYDGPATAALGAMTHAARWLRDRAGSPPVLRGDDPAPAPRALACLLAGIADGRPAESASSVTALARDAAFDHGMVILDLALGVHHDDALVKERRRRRLRLSTA